MTDSEMTTEEVARNLRQRVVEVLQLVASKDQQLAYQRSAPHVHVADEIFNQWEDYYRPGSEEFEAAFSQEELRALSEFNEVFVEICKETPQVMPVISDFVVTDAWRKYSAAAETALATVGTGPH